MASTLAEKFMSILRTIFGPSKDEIWSQIAKDIGGQYTDGGFFGKDVLVYRHGEWQILLDTYTVSSGKYSTTYTRIRAPFVNKDGLYFKIYRENVFSSIGKFFGMQDIEVGEPLFDENFIIKGNNQEKVKLLLSDKNLKKLVEKQPDIYIEIRDDEGSFGAHFPVGVDELYFQCYGVMKDAELL